MKRPASDSALGPGLFPVSQPLRGRFVLYGNICIDCTLQVPSFPKEDSSQRAQSYVKKTGGNCANSCTVLAQLVANKELLVSSLCIIPDRQNPDAAPKI